MRPAAIMTMGPGIWAVVVGMGGVGVLYFKLLLVREFMNMVPISFMCMSSAVGVGVGFSFWSGTTASSAKHACNNKEKKKVFHWVSFKFYDIKIIACKKIGPYFRAPVLHVTKAVRKTPKNGIAARQLRSYLKIKT